MRADAILARVLHAAPKLALTGESLRKQETPRHDPPIRQKPLPMQHLLIGHASAKCATKAQCAKQTGSLSPCRKDSL